MAVTIDIMDEIFAETQNDMEQIISAAREEFYQPETERETVRIWIQLPLLVKEAITAKNPKLAKDLDKKAEQLRKGDMNYGIR